jgi:hypothetical protein
MWVVANELVNKHLSKERLHVVLSSEDQESKVNKRLKRFEMTVN